ncbi:MAG: IS200/IS605 family transposase [candidate division Zixibacteria bacterium]|nr:IS200/IS605 family transposase [candidate division Zixibacteria bacterium]
MPQSHTQILIHAIFSTKNREPLILPPWRSRLFAYVAGIINESGGTTHLVNGTADHVHILLDLPRERSVSEMMRLAKTNSSKWIHEQFPAHRSFRWQNGYGAFSVSASAADRVKTYIARQEEHHRRKTFQEEYISFLKKHGISYDERYIWD